MEKYEKMSDNDLIISAQQGDSDAVVVLLRRYMPLIKSRSSYFYNGTEEMDDLVQESIIAFYHGIKSYNFSLSSFSAFARLCIDRTLISAARAKARKKQIPSDKFVSLEENLSMPDVGTPESILIDTENLSALQNNIKLLLSKREYKILMLYLHSYSVRETAAILNVTEKSVNNALYRIHNKLSKL